MRRRSILFAAASVVLAATSALLGAPRAAEAGYVNRNVTIRQISRNTLWLEPGTYTFETRTNEPSTDPFMHVWGPRYILHCTTSCTWEYTGTGEVAHDDDGAGVGWNSKVTLMVPVAGSYTILVRSYSGPTNGTGSILKNGAPWVSGQSFGGTGFWGPFTTGFRYETAAPPGGTKDSMLYLLDCDYRLLGWDDDGGVGVGSRIESRSDSCGVWASSYYQVTGTTNVYVNDYTTDADGDGLGRDLEAELQTCDARDMSGCSSDVDVPSLIDSDKDGITDAAETFGIDDPNFPQYLPMWGATPRHKDVFVELDYTSQFASNPLTVDDGVTVQNWFAAGAAADLKNPDGVDGLRIHLDLGADGGASTIAGSWGGSNQANTTNYRTAPDDTANFAAVRRGIFRYALMGKDYGGGQAYGFDRFGWGGQTSNRYMNAFAHELGHNLNLRHWGHDSWGKANCKPNYVSMMNYGFTAAEAGGFSRGTRTSVTLNPASVSEVTSYGATSPAYLAAPFGLGISGNTVDWNRDQSQSDGSGVGVRAPVNFALERSCGNFTVNAQALSSDPLGIAVSPRLVRYGTRMYAFFARNGQLKYKHAEMNGAGSDGSCPLGSQAGTACTTWSSEIAVPTTGQIGGIGAAASGTRLVLAYKTPSGDVRTFHFSNADGSGVLQGQSTDTLRGTSFGEPELAVLDADIGRYGTSRILALFGTSLSSHKWWQSTDDGASFSAENAVLDAGGAVVQGAIAPSIATWPAWGTPSAYRPAGRACGVFPDATDTARFHCYNKSTDRWDGMPSAFSSGVGAPVIASRPALAVHVLRSDSGTPLGSDLSRSQYWLWVVPKVGAPKVLISSPMSLSNVPGDGTRFLRIGDAESQWTGLTVGTAIVAFEDYDTAAMKGAWVTTDATSTDIVTFFPLFDGTVRLNMNDGNDFRVMERGACLIQGAFSCGSANAWGY